MVGSAAVGCAGAVGFTAALLAEGAYQAYRLRLHAPAEPTREADIEAAGHRFVRLPDGRKLEYSVTGRDDGVPVYLQHGHLGSCCMAPCIDRLMKELGVKLIAASMPGFGLSDSYPLGRTRKLSEWPADVLAVLDAEGVTGSCHIWGVSAGCVHAAALARGLPEGRVGNVLFCAPTAPESEHLAGAKEGTSVASRVVRALLARPCSGDFVAYALQRQGTMSRMRALPDVRAALVRGLREHPEETEWVIRSGEHGTSWTHRGIVDNYGTLQEELPWLPELGRLTQRGHAMAVTSAPDDTTSPPPAQKWFQAQIPGCAMMEMPPGWGHAHGMIPPGNVRRIYGFLKTGKDEAQDEAKDPKGPATHGLGGGSASDSHPAFGSENVDSLRTEAGMHPAFGSENLSVDLETATAFEQG
mmetsp:Transcript_51821/g.152721  ORF Transcript_51821/g.152721 Transcript_51821/m.152721 type:complete len:413 (-) Transcript_51821:387-1625(-)